MYFFDKMNSYTNNNLDSPLFAALFLHQDGPSTASRPGAGQGRKHKVKDNFPRPTASHRNSIDRLGLTLIFCANLMKSSNSDLNITWDNC